MKKSGQDLFHGWIFSRVSLKLMMSNFCQLLCVPIKIYTIQCFIQIFYRLKEYGFVKFIKKFMKKFSMDWFSF